MKKSKALESIYNILLGESSLYVKLRNAEGIEPMVYKELVSSIEIVTQAYKNNDFVPKKLALCFVDISNALYASESLYTKEEFEKLEDMVVHLQYLAEELFV